MNRIKNLFYDITTGLWCMIWALPVFIVWFAASVFSNIILEYRKTNDNGKNKRSR